MSIEDPTEAARRAMVPVANALTDDQIEAPTWDTEALQRDFVVEGFLAPFCIVRRKSDGVRGSLSFRHSPRVYFDFQPYTGKGDK
jgi:hypothetical protein